MTPEEINALPERVRNYICEVETLCDPQFLISQNCFLRDQIAGLQIMYRKVADELAELKAK